MQGKGVMKHNLPMGGMILLAAANDSSSLCEGDSVDGHNAVICGGRPQEVPVGGWGWGATRPTRHQLHQSSLQPALLSIPQVPSNVMTMCRS